MMRRLLLVWWVGVFGLAGALGCVRAAPVRAEAAWAYLGQTQIPPGTVFGGTPVGGLSGISYDAGRDCYYVISDDRSAKGPARFYTVRLGVSGGGIDGATVIDSRPLLDADGAPFSPHRASPDIAPPDPEGIAFDAHRQRLYWSSEGERVTDGQTVLADPWVRIAGLDGRYQGRFAMPANLTMSAQHTGPRRNAALEGLTLAPDGRLLFAGMEGPLYDDGAPPDQAHGALVRVTAFDVEAAAPVAQYAYPLEPATAPAKTNGLSDLVALSDTEFLVIERAFSAVPMVRIFHADLAGATDVLAIRSLAGGAVTPMRKTLVAELSPATVNPLDNIEGITLGPALPDGRRSIVLVSDDNFFPGEVTQFVLMAG